MEENLDKNNEVNKEISENTFKSNSEEIKVPKPEKNEILINLPILTSWRVHLKYLNEVF